MAAIDVVAISTETNDSTFDVLPLRRYSEQADGQLLRFWDARNIKKDAEFMGIVFLLLDENCSIIHNIIPNATAEQFRNYLRDGVIFGLRKFDVGRWINLYKMTYNLIAIANYNLELPDEVRELKFLKQPHLNETPSTQKLERYNLEIQKKYTAKINLRSWAKSESIKYLFKYIKKEVDRTTFIILNGNDRKPEGTYEDSGIKTEDVINNCLHCHYVSACEDMRRIFKFNTEHKIPADQQLEVYLHGEQKQFSSREISIWPWSDRD